MAGVWPSGTWSALAPHCYYLFAVALCGTVPSLLVLLPGMVRYLLPASRQSQAASPRFSCARFPFQPLPGRPLDYHLPCRNISTWPTRWLGTATTKPMHPPNDVWIHDINWMDWYQGRHMCYFLSDLSFSTASTTCLFSDQEGGNEKEALSSDGPFQTFLWERDGGYKALVEGHHPITSYKTAGCCRDQRLQW